MSEKTDSNRRTNRRNALKAFAGTVSALGLAGCTSDGESGDTGGSSQNSGTTGTTRSGEWPDLSGQELTIQQQITGDEVKTYWNKLGQQFQRDTGAKINMRFTGLGDALNEIAQMVQTGNAPDLSSTTLANATYFQNLDLLEPLTDTVNEAIDRIGEPTKHTTLKIDGEHYGFPRVITGTTWWYRSDLSDIKPDTWENALAYAEDVDSNTDIAGSYIPTNTEGSYAYTHHLNWAWSNETYLCTRDSDGNVVSYLNDEENRNRWIEVLDQIKQMYQYSPDSGTAGAVWSNGINSIQQEVAAQNYYSGVRPKNYAINNDRSFAKDVKVVAPFPTNGDRRGARLGTGSFLHFRNTNSEAAKTFLTWWSQRERLTDYYFQFARVQRIPPWTSVRTSDEFYQRVVDSVNTDVWQEEQIKNYLYQPALSEGWGLHLPNETTPPNPYAGNVLSSNILRETVARYCIQDKEAGALIDDAHQRLESVLEDARSQ